MQHGDAVNIVLNRLFPRSRVISVDTLSGEIAVRLANSVVASVVFKACPDNSRPVAVRLAPAIQVRDEKANYDKWSPSGFGGTYLHQDQVKTFWDVGGAPYELRGWNGATPLLSFGQHYRNETDPERVWEPLDSYFELIWHEEDRLLAGGPSPLFGIYNQVLSLRQMDAEIQNSDR